jgi:hypothetical protein
MAETRFRRLPQVAALLVAAAVVAAGCGGGGRLSKAQYEKTVQAEGRKFQEASKKLSTAGVTSAQALKTAKDALEQAADDLDGVRPPKDVEADNHKVVVGLRALASALDKINAAKGNPARQQKALQELTRLKPVEQAQAAINDMKRKGYDLGLFGQNP